MHTDLSSCSLVSFIDWLSSKWRAGVVFCLDPPLVGALCLASGVYFICSAAKTFLAF